MMITFNRNNSRRKTSFGSLHFFIVRLARKMIIISAKNWNKTKIVFNRKKINPLKVRMAIIYFV